MTARRKKPGARASARGVYFFGDGRAAGSAGMRDVLGGKGANLAEMTRLGIPVPPGFTISTQVCRDFTRARGRIPARVRDEVRRALRRVERSIGARFGDPDRPLLVPSRCPE